MGTKPYCGDCPDRETCQIGASCEFVRSAAAMFKQLDEVMTGKGRPIMSNSPKTTVTPADVAAKAAEENLITTVPAQGEGEKVKVTGDEELTDTIEVVEDEKKTAKDRFKALVAKAKDNKQFFMGVVVGAVAASITVVKLAKEKVEELSDLTDEDAAETDTPDDSTA